MDVTHRLPVRLVNGKYQVGDRDPVYAKYRVTELCSKYMNTFDANEVVRNCFSKWRSNEQSPYHTIIMEGYREGKDDEEIMETIVRMWDTKRREASEKGTLLHADAEKLCQGDRSVLSGAFADEMQSLLRWIQKNQLSVVDTEVSVYWEDSSNNEKQYVLVAGTFDALFRDPNGDLWLVDFKSTNPKRSRNGTYTNLIRPWREDEDDRWKKFAKHPIEGVQANDHGKYSMQLNILSKILRDRYDMDVKSNMHIVQLHKDLKEAHHVVASDLTSEVNTLFDYELKASY